MRLLQRLRSGLVALVSRSSRRARIAAAAVAVAAVGGLVWQLNRPDTATAQAQTVEVTRGTIQQTVTGSGTIEPRQQADLDFSVSGRVTSVKVEPGDTVARGDVLATLDTTSLDAALASARAQLTAAQTTAANDGSESSAQQAANTASVASAEADLADAEDDLDATTLRATFAGTVADVTIEVGDQVGSSSGVGSLTTGGQGGSQSGSDATATTTSTAITVISPRKFVVEASVAAADVEQVKDGLQATITPNGASETVYGTVADVGRVAETSTSGTASYPVSITVTGEHDDLYAGTTADVSIVVKQVEDVLTVPTMAVTSEDGTTYVQKVDGSSTKPTEIEIGETYGQSTEVVSGLSEGDQVRITIGTMRRTQGGSGGQGGGFPSGGQLPGGGQMPPGGQVPGGLG